MTYEGHLPFGSQLIPRHYVKWLKRLRKEVKTPLRFFIVGEYGEKHHRAHYHLALYGFPPCGYLNYKTECRVKECWPCQTIKRTWGFGRVTVGDLTLSSAQYVAGYVTKKMTNPFDPRLNGRHPEFARMSLNGGLGVFAMDVVADVLTSDKGVYAMEAEGDVPVCLSYGKKKMPLGRYLRRKLREKYGFKDTKTPEEKLLQFSIQMSDLFKEKGKEKVLQEKKQKILNLEARTKIYSQRRSF